MNSQDQFAAPGKTLGDRALQGWNRFWFSPGDPTVLGLIRICCGLVTLYTTLAYSLDLQEFFGPHAWWNLESANHRRHLRPYTVEPLRGLHRVEPTVPPMAKDAAEQKFFEDYYDEFGIHPALTYARGKPSWSVWYHVTDPTGMVLIHMAICLVTFLFTIGFCTRITSVLTWIGQLCYIHRTTQVLFGVDTMMTILLFYLMIGPSGAAYSVDRLIARWWSRAKPDIIGRWRSFWRRPAGVIAPAPVPSHDPVPSISANVAIRLLQVHVCFIYLAAGLAKMLGQSWWDGTAVWGTLANYEFAPMQFEIYNSILRLLGHNKMVLLGFLTIAAYFTLFFEIGYAFLIWRPATRWLMLSMAIVLHGMIGLFMGLKTFSLMMLVMNMAFLKPAEVRWFFAMFSRKGKGEASASTPSTNGPELAVAGTATAVKRKK
jgi:hypothetical protein